MMPPISSLPEAQSVFRGHGRARPLEQHVGRWIVRGILSSVLIIVPLACGYGARITGGRLGPLCQRDVLLGAEQFLDIVVSSFENAGQILEESVNQSLEEHGEANKHRF
jgi:hypothetical protein